MTYIAVTLLLALALLGHAALWVSLVNRLNAYAIDHSVLRWINRGCLAVCAILPPVLAVWLVWHWLAYRSLAIYELARGEASPLLALRLVVLAYLAVCVAVSVWALLVWAARLMLRDQARAIVQTNHTQQFDVAKLLGKNLAGPGKAKYCARIPGNQLFQFHTQTKHIALSNLPPALEGFSIVHLSDLHFAGHVQREFHEEVVRQTNLLDAEVIAITGDIIDRPQCFEWFASTIGQLRARHGVYFILGNHDGRRTKPDDVRRALVDLGLVDLGGRAALIEHNGARVLLAGNELPWFKAPPATDSLPASPSDADVLSVLLSHSPDQFAWAQREGYQLMLAGHVHGGQIRLPIVGPLLSPSRYGVRYACGFFVGRPTLMHVTRGVSGLIPLRFNCPPEVAKLVLHR